MLDLYHAQDAMQCGSMCMRSNVERILSKVAHEA